MNKRRKPEDIRFYLKKLKDQSYEEPNIEHIAAEVEIETSNNQNGGSIPSEEEPLFTYKLVKEYEKINPSFKATRKVRQFEVNHLLGNLGCLFEAESRIDDLYEVFVDDALKDKNLDDRFSVSISSDSLENPIFISNKKIREYSKQDLLNALQNVAQSNKSFLLDGKFTIEIMIIEALSGQGRAPQTLNDRAQKSRSIITLKNRDHLCGYIAIYLGKKFTNIESKNKQNGKTMWKRLLNNQYAIKEKTIKWFEKNQLSTTDPLTIDIAKQVQEKLKEKFSINIIDRDTKQRLFGGNTNKQRIFIEYISPIRNALHGHYNMIKSIKAYLRAKAYCFYCHSTYRPSNSHSCTKRCKNCLGYPICTESETVSCQECNRYFSNQECYKNHKLNKTCDLKKRCPSCLKIYENRVNHQCGKRFCKNCNEEYEDLPHFCYIKPIKQERIQREDKIGKFIVCFDIETTQSSQTGLHIAMLLICQVCCDRCWNYETNKRNLDLCTNCGHNEKIYWGRKCVKQFGDYLYQELAIKAQKSNSQIYCYAHNLKGFDGHFLIQDLWARRYPDAEVIMQGTKILFMSTGNVRFIDSLNLFMQALSKLPKAFGIENYVQKGWFPHLFNQERNWSYKGSYPKLCDYGIEYMKPDEARKVELWHQMMIRDEKIFDFKDEIIKYCSNDVEILIKSIMIFKKTFKEITGMDPLTNVFTLPSLCFRTFRTKWLPSKAICIPPIGSFVSDRKRSIEGEAWLDWLQKSKSIVIEREIPLSNVFVDGYHQASNTVYEFFGCFYHCCPCTFKYNRDSQQERFQNEFVIPQNLYQTAKLKVERLKASGYKVISIWEHEWNNFLSDDLEAAKYIKTRKSQLKELKKVGRLNPRDSFFGGRTGNFVMTCDLTDRDRCHCIICTQNKKLDKKERCETIEKEEILYTDFTSEYPYVLKNKPFPVGPPTIITENFKKIAEYNGLIKCSILPPKKLHVPVLPYRANGKLLFPLCKKCAEDKNREYCNHQQNQRSLIGTWTTPELVKALEVGYRILKIFEVVHFDSMSDSLFKGYVNAFLKIKQQASDWPDWCDSVEKKSEYLSYYKDNEGVELDFEKIESNPALRAIAKLALNSLWGKISQRPNLPKTAIIYNYNDLWNIINDEKIEVKSNFLVDDYTMMVTYYHKNELDAKPGNSSAVIASFVTAYARLSLYEEMEKIESSRTGRLLYSGIFQ